MQERYPFPSFLMTKRGGEAASKKVTEKETTPSCRKNHLPIGKQIERAKRSRISDNLIFVKEIGTKCSMDLRVGDLKGQCHSAEK